MTINKLYNVDCRTVEYQETDLIISDPPYNIGYSYLEYDDKMTEAEYSKLFETFKGKRCVFIHYPEETIKYIVSALGVPKKVVTWVYNTNTKKQHRMISWYNCEPDFSKVKQPYKNLTDKRILKRLAEGFEGADLYDWWNIDLVKNTSSEKTEYTNQIPEEIVSRIIKITAKKTDTIIDPFNGSGTTCVVAQKLGYNWKGYDISKKAIEIANKRLQPLLNNLFKQ
jgi:DNA modification methylase